LTVNVTPSCAQEAPFLGLARNGFAGGKADSQLRRDIP
jgi:hypothetical protein